MVATIQFTGQLWVPPLVCCGATAPTVENELWGALQSMALATIKPIKIFRSGVSSRRASCTHCAVRNRARFTVLSEVGTGASHTATIISTRHVAQRVVADGYCIRADRGMLLGFSQPNANHEAPVAIDLAISAGTSGDDNSSFAQTTNVPPANCHRAILRVTAVVR